MKVRPKIIWPKDVIGQDESLSEDNLSEGCDCSRRKSVRRMIRPKDVIGWYKDSSKEWSVWRMWLIYTKIRPKDDPSEGCDWPRQKSVQRMLRSLLIGWAKATYPYDEASALLSCQTNLIWQEGNLIFSLWTRLIGPSDGLVLLRTLLIGLSADQLPVSSLGFLAAQFQTCKRTEEKTITRNVFFGLLRRVISDMQARWQENDYAKRLLWATNVPFWSVLDAKTDKTNVTLFYLLYPMAEYIYCALCSLMELGNCVCCSWVVLMSTCSEYYD